MKKRAQLITILVLFTFLNSYLAHPIKNMTVKEPLSGELNNKLDFAFLLHANQANVPYGDVANDLNYYHIMKALRNHPDLHFPLHFSGTLLTDLAWFNQSTLNLLRDGYDTGQFEIIGSTYAQNIIYSHIDDYDNEIQIDKHRQVISSIIGANPTGFWNPERCWNQSRYVELLVNGGYEYTFIEDQILEQSTVVTGFDEYKVRTTSHNGKTIKIVNDDKSVIAAVDNIAFTTEESSHPDVEQAVDDLIALLQSIYTADADDDYLVFYGQDMEAWGLWQEEGWNIDGRDISDSIERVADRLDYMLTRLKQESSWLNIVTPGEFIESLPIDYAYEHVEPYVDGQAHWMQMPSQDEGFVDWFDFNENDSRLIDYRSQFLAARNRLKFIDNAIMTAEAIQNVTPAKKLMSYARFVYSAHQYEFGCIGCYFPWFYGVKMALITAEAAYYSLSPSYNAESIVFDWDLDGHDEYILRNNRGVFVLSGTGGRLVNWFDLRTGKVLLANDVPATYSGVGGQSYPFGTPFSAPIDQVNPVNLWGRTSNSYLLRQKAFNDMFIVLNTVIDEDYWKSAERTASNFGNSVDFTFERNGINLVKQYILDNDENFIDIHYTIQNNNPNTITPNIGIALNPDNEELLLSGAQGLEFSMWEENSQHHLLINENISKTSIKMEMGINGISGISKDGLDPMFSTAYTITLDKVVTGETLVVSFSLYSPEEYIPIVDDEFKIPVAPQLFVLCALLGVGMLIVIIKHRTGIK